MAIWNSPCSASTTSPAWRPALRRLCFRLTRSRELRYRARSGGATVAQVDEAAPADGALPGGELALHHRVERNDVDRPTPTKEHR